MGHRVASFSFDADGTFATGVSTATFNYTTSVVTIDGVGIGLADMPLLAQAITELLAQNPADGTFFTSNETAGGVVVVFHPVNQTIKVGALPAWPIPKAQSLVIAIGVYIP